MRREAGGQPGKWPRFSWGIVQPPVAAAGPMAGVTGPCPLMPLLPQNDGRLRLSRQGVIFKNSKTGKVDNIQASELAEGVWRRVALGHGLKLLTKNGHVYKYDGFRESVSPPAHLVPAGGPAVTAPCLDCVQLHSL